MMLALFDPATDSVMEKVSVTAGGIFAAIYYAKEIFYPRKQSSQLDVNIVETLATKNELKEVERATKAEDAILHKRITDQGTNIQKTIAHIPHELMALLKNAGIIH